MKKYIALCLTIILSWTLCACGSNAQTSDSGVSEAESVQEAASEAAVSTPEEASEADSTVPIIDRLLKTEGKVYNIYASDRKLLNILRKYDEEYEDNSVSANGASLSENSVSNDDFHESSVSEGSLEHSAEGNSSVSENSQEKENNGEVTETGKIGDVTVRWHFIENDPDQYETILDRALVNENASADDQVDLFLVDGDMVAKYTDATANVSKPLTQLGLSEADLGQQYEFTKLIGSDEKEAQRAFTWEVPCGIFLYRRSAAMAVLGTDNPVQVQESVKDWDTFQTTAASALSAGYHMLSGYTDAYYAYLSQRKEGWVDEEDQLSVDPVMASWVHTTKEFSDKGYTKKRVGYHSSEWQQDVREDRQLFGTFMTASDVRDYLIGDRSTPFSISENASVSGNGSVSSNTAVTDAVSENSEGKENPGDWAVCRGPAEYSQGGEWILAASNSDNLSLTRDLIRRVFCNADVMSAITRDTGEMTNSMTAMKEIGDDSLFGIELFGNQNYVRVYDTAARSCGTGKRTLYDHEINTAFMNAFTLYFAGESDEGKALNQFYTEVVNEYPDLSY